MSEKSIRLSRKHGLNPSIPKCFFCGEDKNEIILFGHIKGDKEAPRGMVFNQDPCDKCQDLMKQGVILISVDEKKTGNDKQNPYRTGGWIVLKDEAAQRIFTEVFNKEAAENVLKKRVAFVVDEVWDAIGFPRGEINAEEAG